MSRLTTEERELFRTIVSEDWSRAIALSRSQPNAAAEYIEITVWRRHLGPKLLERVEAELAAAGDRAEPELISLQHTLAALLQPHASHLTQPNPVKS